LLVVTQQSDAVSEILESSHKLENQDVLTDLLKYVKSKNYKFITTTPRTHAHFLLQVNARGNSLRNIFGWNTSFSIDAIDSELKTLMVDAGVIQVNNNLARSKLRISSLGSDLFFHSAFPTTEADAIFFGPDTYRFARFIRQSLEKIYYLSSRINSEPVKKIRILDIGCGTGAGGITAVRALPESYSYEVTMNDLNQKALDATLVNSQVSNVAVNILAGDIFEVLQGEFDLIISNPPYMKDESGRAYRDGGEQLGLDLSLRIFETAVKHLASGGTLLLYTGVAMTSDVDPFLATITPLLDHIDCTWFYEEIDPDIFGEELELPTYAQAHRIAAVGLVVTKS